MDRLVIAALILVVIGSSVFVLEDNAIHIEIPLEILCDFGLVNTDDGNTTALANILKSFLPEGIDCE